MPPSEVRPLSAIDAAWLEGALGRPSVLNGERHRSIGTGQVGENVRFELDWADPGAGPVSVVGKFPSLDETSRATAAATSSYVREIGFYRDLQSTVRIRTPRIHLLQEDLDNNDFLLLMEDIRPAAAGDQLAGCSVAEASLAVSALGGLHGPHWGEPPPLEWLSRRTPEGIAELWTMYDLLYPAFVDRYGDRLGDEVVQTGADVGRHLYEWLDGYCTQPTVVHGDYRLDNILFGAGPPAPPVTVVDWQTTAIGHGPADAAYFIGAGLLPDVRRASERMLFDVYVDALRGEGVTEERAPVDDLWADYRLGSASGYLMAVIASMIVGQTDRGDQMFIAMAERHSAQMIDLDWTSFFIR